MAAITTPPPPCLNRRRNGRTDHAGRRAPATIRRQPRQQGLSLIELMLALAISAVLLTATMVALDVTFKAYADAAEQASTQAATRMVTNRLLTLIRTSTAHGPLNVTNLPVGDPANPFTFPLTANVNGNLVTSNYINVFDPNNNDVHVAYDANQNMLFLSIEPPGGGGPQVQPLLGGVTAATFSGARRLDDDGLWILDRGTMDLTVQPDADTTLAIENGNAPPIRVIGSTMPRKIN